MSGKHRYYYGVIFGVYTYRVEQDILLIQFVKLILLNYLLFTCMQQRSKIKNEIK